MRVCLLSPAAAAPGPSRAIGRLAELLSQAHEVAVVEPAPSPELERITFSCDAHRESAEAMAAIRAHYGSSGPDYLEVLDFSPLALVPLQARRTGDPLLAETLVAVRAWPGFELRSFQDGTLEQPLQRLTAELGREQLRLADRLIWPGGDSLGLYRRYYEGLELPATVRIGFPVAPPPRSAPPPGQSAGQTLRILFLGSLDAHAGPLDLVDACLGLPGDDWELTLAGADSDTATMGQSVRIAIEAMAGHDPRVRVEGPMSERERAARLPDFDLLAVPSRVGPWSEEALAAMWAGVPVLCTPVGALTELVLDGETGWHAAGEGAEPLRQALARLLAEPEELERVRSSGRIESHVAALAEPAALLDGYLQIAAAAERTAELGVPARPRAELPLVTGVIPYYGAAPFVGEAVESLLGQTHPRTQVLIVNDGSFREEDSVLSDLERDPRVTVVTQANGGETSARNLGALLAQGEYMVMLDADNLLEPGFVERALAAYRRHPELAYVTCWLRVVDEIGVEFEAAHGYAPLGNGVVADDQENFDGDSIALLPRRLFTELGFTYGPVGAMHGDWELYRWLRQEGRFGAVIPERLARYRVRADSLLREHSKELQGLGWNEARTRNRRRRMRWIAR